MAAAAHYLTSGGMPATVASPSSAGTSSASWQMAGLPLTAMMAFPAGKPPAVASSHIDNILATTRAQAPASPRFAQVGGGVRHTYAQLAAALRDTRAAEELAREELDDAAAPMARPPAPAHAP